MEFSWLGEPYYSLPIANLDNSPKHRAFFDINRNGILRPTFGPAKSVDSNYFVGQIQIGVSLRKLRVVHDYPVASTNLNRSRAIQFGESPGNSVRSTHWRGDLQDDVIEVPVSAGRTLFECDKHRRSTVGHARQDVLETVRVQGRVDTVMHGLVREGAVHVQFQSGRAGYIRDRKGQEVVGRER